MAAGSSKFFPKAPVPEAKALQMSDAAVLQMMAVFDKKQTFEKMVASNTSNELYLQQQLEILQGQINQMEAALENPELAKLIADKQYTIDKQQMTVKNLLIYLKAEIEKLKKVPDFIQILMNQLIEFIKQHHQLKLQANQVRDQILGELKKMIEVGFTTQKARAEFNLLFSSIAEFNDAGNLSLKLKTQFDLTHFIGTTMADFKIFPNLSTRLGNLNALVGQLQAVEKQIDQFKISRFFVHTSEKLETQFSRAMDRRIALSEMLRPVLVFIEEQQLQVGKEPKPAPAQDQKQTAAPNPEEEARKATKAKILEDREIERVKLTNDYTEALKNLAKLFNDHKASLSKQGLDVQPIVNIIDDQKAPTVFKKSQTLRQAIFHLAIQHKNIQLVLDFKQCLEDVAKGSSFKDRVALLVKNHPAPQQAEVQQPPVAQPQPPAVQPKPSAAQPKAVAPPPAHRRLKGNS